MTNLTYQESIERIASILAHYDKEPTLDNEMIVFASMIYKRQKIDVLADVSRLMSPAN